MTSTIKNLFFLLMMAVMFLSAAPPCVLADAAENWQVLRNNFYRAYIAGEFEKATEYSVDVLRVAEQTFAEDDVRLAVSIGDRGMIEFAKENYKAAEKYYLESLYRSVESLGGEDPLLSVGYIKLGEVYLAQNKLEEARKAYESAYGFIKNHRAYFREHGASLRLLLGLIEFAEGEHKAALHTLKEALEIAIRSVGAGHAELRPFYIEYAEVAERAGDSKLARSLREQALLLFDKQAQEHPERLELLKQLALEDR